MAFYKYENTELLNIVSSNLTVRRDGVSSNIAFELASNSETRIGMIVDDQFRGFMSNTNGLFFSSNNAAGFKQILGPGDLTITAVPPLTIVGDTIELGYDTNELTLVGLGSNLLGLANLGITNSKLGNSNIIIDSTTLELGSSYSALTWDLQNAAGLPFTGLTGNINSDTQIANSSIQGHKLANSTITNGLLANSNIIIGTVPVVLGGAIYSIPISNISGVLPVAQLPTDLENTALSQVVITSGNLTISNLAADYLITQTANITDRFWLGSQPSANLSLVNGSWFLDGANLGLSAGQNMDVGGNLWVAGNGDFTGNIQVANLDADLVSTSNLAVLDTLHAQNANISGQLWLGNPLANLSMSSGNLLVAGTNLNISAGYDINLLDGDLVIGGTGNISAPNSLIQGANLEVFGGITAQTANIQNRLWLGNQPTANLSLVGGGWFLDGANLGLANGQNMDVGGNLWVGQNAYISGNMTVYGETTIINSNVVTVLDPVITLGGNTAPTLDDQMDRGVAFRWYDSEVGSAARLGFMGFRDSDRTFRFIPNATDTNQVFTGANGSAAFDAMTLDSNLSLLDLSSVIGWGTGASAAGIRLNGANLEVKSNSTAAWYRLFTAQEINNGAALAKSGVDNLTLDVRYDNASIGLNGTGQLALKSGGIANSNLANSNIGIGGITYELGTQTANLVLVGANSIVLDTGNINWGAGSSSAGIRLSGANLEVKSNSTAGWFRLFTAQELTNGTALAKSGVDNLTLDVQYDNNSIGLDGSGRLALKSGGVLVSNLAEPNIYIGGTTYTLGQQNANLALQGSNAVVFGGQSRNYISADSSVSSNLVLSSAGNIQINSAAASSAATGVIVLSANAASATAADVLFTGASSSRIGMTLIDAANSVITMGGTSLGTAGYGFRNNSGVISYRNSADLDWTQLVSLNQLVAGAGIGFDQATNTVYTLTDNTTIETATPGTANLQVKDGGITGVKLANTTITNDKLANTAITISGVGYSLGSSTANLAITGSNLILFGTGTPASIGLTGGATGNLSITTTGNLTVGKHLIAANTFTTSVYSNAALTNMSGTQTLALDFGEASSFLLTLAANADITLSNPGNVNRVGQQGVIYVATPSTGSGHILRWYKSSNDSAWFFPGGSGGFAPSISVANSVYDVFNYVVLAASPAPVVLVTDATGFSRYS